MITNLDNKEYLDYSGLTLYDELIKDVINSGDTYNIGQIEDIRNYTEDSIRDIRHELNEVKADVDNEIRNINNDINSLDEKVESYNSNLKQNIDGIRTVAKSNYVKLNNLEKKTASIDYRLTNAESAIAAGIESGEHVIDALPTNGNTDHLVSSDGVYRAIQASSSTESIDNEAYFASSFVELNAVEELTGNEVSGYHFDLRLKRGTTFRKTNNSSAYRDESIYPIEGKTYPETIETGTTDTYYVTTLQTKGGITNFGLGYIIYKPYTYEEEGITYNLGEFYIKQYNNVKPMVLDDGEYLFGEIYFYYTLPNKPSVKVTRLNVLGYQIKGEYEAIYGFDDKAKSGSTNLMTSDSIYRSLTGVTESMTEYVEKSNDRRALINAYPVEFNVYKKNNGKYGLSMIVRNETYVYIMGGIPIKSYKLVSEDQSAATIIYDITSTEYASNNISFDLIFKLEANGNSYAGSFDTRSMASYYAEDEFLVGKIWINQDTGRVGIVDMNCIGYKITGEFTGILGYDDIATEGSTSNLTSGGVYDSIKDNTTKTYNREAMLNSTDLRFNVGRYINESGQTKYKLIMTTPNRTGVILFGGIPKDVIYLGDGDSGTTPVLSYEISGSSISYDLIFKVSNSGGTYTGEPQTRPLSSKFKDDEFLLGRIWFNENTGVINIFKMNCLSYHIDGDYTRIVGFDNVPTEGSSYLLTSDTIYNELEKKENKNTLKPKLEVRVWDAAFGDKHKSVTLFDVRTKFNETEDVITRYYAYPNNYNICPKFMAIVPSDHVFVSEADLKNNARIYNLFNDITSPLHGTPEYWAIFQQHGYDVPTWVIPSTDLSISVGDNLTGIVNGNVETTFTVGRISESATNTTLYLLPELEQDGASYTRKWHHEDTITSLSGSTSEITNILSTGISGEGQIGPISENTDRKFIIDGTEITAGGIYYGNEFSASETRIGYDPATIETWSPLADTTGAEEMAKFVWTHKFFGTSCIMTSTIEMLKDAEFTGYGPIQMMFPPAIGTTEKTKFIYPKVKGYDTPFDGDSSFVITRSDTDLNDVNEIPDRIIYYTEDERESGSEGRKIGISAGFSLVSGDSVKGKMEEYMPVYDSKVGNDIGRLAHFWANKTSANTVNYYKAYQYGMNAQKFVKEEGGKLRYFVPKSFFREFTTYYTIFDPSKNERGDLNYWYKENDDYIIYLHSYVEGDNIQIYVPDFMEGMYLSVVEKTDNAELMSEQVLNNKIFVTYTGGDSLKYITVKVCSEQIKYYDTEINNLEDRTDAVEELLSYVSSESEYQDPNVLKYIVDENNSVIAEIQKSGAVKKYAKTEEEKIAEDKLEHLSTVSEYQDPNVLKYILDEDNKCLGYIEKDGTFNFYKVRVQHKDDEDVSNNELWTIVGLLANSCDTVKMTKNKKAMNTIYNISTPKTITLNTENSNKVNLTPKISIIDDDTIDGQIPSSKGGSTPESAVGGYFSMLLPMLLSLQEKYKEALNGKKLVAGLACEGQRVGLTKIYSEDDSYTSLNENGECVKWIHDNLGWDVFSHSMTAQLPMETYHFERHDSEEARTALRGGYYSTKRSFYNTIMYEDSTGKWYEPADSGLTEWTERTPFSKYAMPFYFDYPGYDVVRDPDTGEIKTDPVTGEPIIRNKPIASNTPAYFNREFDFGYNWGEWFKRADELGLPYERVVVHNGNTSSVYMINGSRSYADFSVRTNGTHNYPPIAASVNRISAVSGSTNAENTGYTQRLKNEVDNCINGKTWMVFMTHANEPNYFRNGYVSGVTYPRSERNYPEQWIVPIKHDDIVAIITGTADVNTPPSALGISTWDQWHPAIGTQAYALYEVLGYAIENGVNITSPMDGWLSHGNIVNIGVDRNGQTYPYDRAENNTPYTDEELSYLTVGADTSIRLYNHKS